MPMVDDLSERFRKNVACSTHVDVAVAWATETPALDQLESAVGEYGVSLRIIVGTHGNATDPDTLDRLNDIGELRLIPHGGPLFHPEVYIFRGEEDSTAYWECKFHEWRVLRKCRSSFRNEAMEVRLEMVRGPMERMRRATGECDCSIPQVSQVQTTFSGSLRHDGERDAKSR